MYAGKLHCADRLRELHGPFAPGQLLVPETTAAEDERRARLIGGERGRPPPPLQRKPPPPPPPPPPQQHKPMPSADFVAAAVVAVDVD